MLEYLKAMTTIQKVVAGGGVLGVLWLYKDQLLVSLRKLFPKKPDVVVPDPVDSVPGALKVLYYYFVQQPAEQRDPALKALDQLASIINKTPLLPGPDNGGSHGQQ